MEKNTLCPVGTEVQSLIFSKENFTEKQAKDWAKNHDFIYGYVDEKENTYRIRQQEPSDFENMRTIEMREGVKAVIGCPINKYVDGGGVNISEARIQDAISRSNKKPEEILSEEVNTDTPKKLNRSEEVVPMSIINEIENEGISIERLESLGLPVYKYQTQITIHGIFEGLTKERVGGYKNLTLNQNKTLGVRYNAIDLEKKKLISNALELDRFKNEDLAKTGFRSRMDSKGFVLSKAKSTQDKAKALEYAKDFKDEANALPYNFIGGKYINIYNVYGIYYVEYSIYLNAIRQDNLWGFISAITDGRIDKDTYNQISLLKKQEEDKEREKYEKELEERNKIAKEKAKNLISNSPYKIINKLPDSREFAIAIVQEYYGSADITVYYVFYNKQNRRVFRKKTYRDWADVLPSISKEPTFMKKNLLMPDADLEILNKKVAKGGYFLVSETPNVKSDLEKKSIAKVQQPEKPSSLDSNDIYEFGETKHTKTGDTIYVLRIKKRLSPEEYKIVESNVKLIRGYYSGFVKGFVLKSKITQNEIERLFEGTSLAQNTEKPEEVLTGGKADKLTIQDIANKHNVSLEYAQEQLKKGIEIESEHTNDVEKQTEIALDHLSEFIDYYVELQKMEKKLESEASVEKSNNPPFKFNEGEYVSIIDEPKTNKENIFKVVGHQNYNENYGWETAIKNLYTDNTVTMFENLLEISDKSQIIKDIINELKDSFREIQEPEIDLHLKVRLDALENEAELEKMKESYPIVIEWSEGNIGDNVGLNNLNELNDKLKQSGFSNRPSEIYIKNKVWFKNYPTYIRIDVSKQKSDFDFEKQHIREWLKNYDKSFDWSIFDNKTESKKEILAKTSIKSEKGISKENYDDKLKLLLSELEEADIIDNEIRYYPESTKNIAKILGITTNQAYAFMSKLEKEGTAVKYGYKTKDGWEDASHSDLQSNSLYWQVSIPQKQKEQAVIDNSQIEELEMLIELTEETLKESPNEDAEMYLELLKSTLQELKNK